MKQKSSIFILLTFFLLVLSQLAAVGSNEDDTAFITKRLKIVGLEIENVKSLGNSIFLVTVKGFTQMHDALRLRPGVRFKPLQVKVRIMGKILKLARTPLLEAGFTTNLPSGGVVLASGLTIDKATTSDNASAEGGLMIDDDD